MVSHLKILFKKFHQDSIYRNSIYLMFSTFLMSIFGFIFWISAARIYSSNDVGLATALISVTSLISTFSLIGLNNGFIRYLPKSELNIRNKIINSSFNLIAFVAALLTTIFVVFINFFSPQLNFIQDNLAIAFLFIIFVSFVTINSIADSIYIAYRSTIYMVIYYACFSITKLLFVLILGPLGYQGIYLSYVLGVISSLSLSYYFLVSKFDFEYFYLIDKKIIKSISKFSITSYIASFAGTLPTLLLPLLITNYIGPKFSAYYYMPMMITNFLYIIPQATSQILFAESSYDETTLRINIKKALIIIFLLLSPAILIVLFFGNYILLAFGKEYLIEANTLLKIFAISSIFVSLNSLLSSVIKVYNQMKKLVSIEIIGMLIRLTLIFTLIHNGLVGIGFAILISQIVLSVIYLITLLKIKKYL